MNRNSLKSAAREWGADFFGVADLEPFRDYPTIPNDLLSSFHRAISLGVALSRSVTATVTDGSNPLYSHHIDRVSEFLDRLALRLSGIIQRKGAACLPLPASQVLDREDYRGALSHKAVARMAGLGWQGKSLLIVNPSVGPRMRLVTILTDLDLTPDRPLENGCGACEECVKACPAGAISGTPFGNGYARRRDAWDMAACTAKLIQDAEERPGIRPFSCGVCIRACPIGRAQKAY